MGTYFATYYMESLYGPGYILTAIIYAIGCAALLRNGHAKKDIVLSSMRRFCGRPVSSLTASCTVSGSTPTWKMRGCSFSSCCMRPC